MNLTSIAEPTSAFATLRQLAMPRAPQQKCELCSAGLPWQHRHLLELATRKLVCACDACALRFPPDLASRFKLVPRDSFVLPEFLLTDAQWNNLAIPINLAFLVRSSADGRVIALYPSPGGVTESQLSPASWDELLADNPVLARMEPDVEVLLLNRVGANREYYLTPIDSGYELTGLLRSHWRGLSGGDAVWHEIEGFFCRLKDRSRSLPGHSQQVTTGNGTIGKEAARAWN